MINKSQNIEREYKGKKNSDIINMPLGFRRSFLSPSDDKEILNMPLYGYKIIFKILNDISMDQFHPENKNQSKQLSLFEEELMTKDNTYIQMSFKVSDICHNRDYAGIKKSLDFLELFKRDWYKSKNSKGKIIQTLGGLISNPVISEGKINFLVSNYWFKELVQIPKYNVALFDTAFKLSNGKQILIYLWLIELQDTGTVVSFDRFQKVYDYNYKSIKTFVKNVLKPLKERLDLYSNKSFNVSVRGSNINIKPYFTKDIELDLKVKTNIKREITRKLSYWKERHKLSEDNINILKTIISLNQGEFKLLLNAYADFVKQCKDNKTKTIDFTNNEFMHVFQENIKKVYKNHSWYDINKEGYPKLQ